MYRTTSVLALGLFLGLAPIGALAQTQSDDTDTQQLTQPPETGQSTETQTMETDDQQATETDTTETEEEADVAEEPEAEPEADVAEEPEAEPEADVAEEPEAEPEEEVAEEPAEEPAGDVIAQQEDDQLLGSSLMGASVNLADESIGTVSDLIIGDDNTIKGVVVGVGGFLGIGEKRVALPMEKITVQPMADQPGEVELSADTTREELESFEEFKTAAQVRSEQEAEQAQQQLDTQQPPQPTAPQQ
jgi:hypothetical protein